MSLGIVLRTVCGCERILAIPFRTPPSVFKVPYIRRTNWLLTPADGESCMTAAHQSREFEYTGQVHQGHLLYVEKL